MERERRCSCRLDGKSEVSSSRNDRRFPMHFFRGALAVVSEVPRLFSRRGLFRGICLVLMGLLLVTGCLPYSCQREANKALFPSDSLSREIARDVSSDTLDLLWSVRGTETHSLEYPRTVRFMEGGGLAVSDAERNSVFRFTEEGQVERETRDEAFDVPYLIGSHGDTLVVFNAGTDRVDRIVEGRRVTNESISFERPAPETLVYMLATDTSLYAKVVGENIDSYVARLDDEGRSVARVSLEGPRWRHAGFLRLWRDSVVSLSGFRPVVNLLPTAFREESRPDTLALKGFDSPMLERSYAFAQGDVSKPPLLTPAAAPVGDLLFVLNLRPGWVQIDAYDRNGDLQHRLVERHEMGDQNFYPLALDARREETGYQFAVTLRSPEPKLELFRWQPSDSTGQTLTSVED